LRGAEPPHFVDRADAGTIGGAGIVAATLAACRGGPGDPRFHQLVVSTPALGRTAQARAVSRQVAGRLGWVVTFHRCRPKERAMPAVAAQTLAGMQRLWPRPPSGRPGGPGTVPVRQLEGLLGPGGEASWTDLLDFFAVAGSFAQRLSRGIMIVLDDADRLGGAEVECAGHLARSLSRDGWPVALLLTGGPQLAQRFARTGNFAGSVWATRLDLFDDSEAREALVVPAAERAVEFDEDALELLCLAAAGRPLEVQRLGSAAWSASARRSGVVSLADAREALELVEPEAAAKAS